MEVWEDKKHKLNWQVIISMVLTWVLKYFHKSFNLFHKRSRFLWH